VRSAPVIRPWQASGGSPTVRPEIGSFAAQDLRQILAAALDLRNAALRRLRKRANKRHSSVGMGAAARVGIRCAGASRVDHRALDRRDSCGLAEIVQNHLQTGSLHLADQEESPPRNALQKNRSLALHRGWFALRKGMYGWPDSRSRKGDRLSVSFDDLAERVAERLDQSVARSEAVGVGEE
jgi:hypothetical protein